MSEQGEIKQAGEGVSDQQMAEQVAEQTPAEERYSDVFEREQDGALTDKEIAKADADDLAGE